MKKTNIEEVRKWLKGYRLNIKEIEARTEHIRWLKNEVYMPLIESGESCSIAAKKVKHIMSDILEEASLYLSKLQYEATVIETEINNLDHFERCVLYNRYILGIPWMELPERVGYEIAQCQRIERRALARLGELPGLQYFLNKNSSSSSDKSFYDLTLRKYTPKD